MVTRENLQERIERVRAQLHALVKTRGRHNAKVLELSRKLDRLILKAQSQKMADKE